MKKDLYASPLEFFPLAYDLCREGNGEKAYCKSGSIGKTSPCMFFSPFNKPGGCTRYNDRGLICRLFGFSSNADKNGCPRLICCRNIKKTQAFCNLTDKDISGSPEFSDFYIRLESIDFALANEQLQINLAINKALEVILNYESLHMHRIPA
ncbi:MAG: hypothetical protein LKI53_01185 [Bacteroidales bacterium]|nr:hypothetical protein [Bacteroidales bacterium]